MNTLTTDTPRDPDRSGPDPLSLMDLVQQLTRAIAQVMKATELVGCVIEEV